MKVVRRGSVIKFIFSLLLLMVGFAQAHTNSVGYTKNGNDVTFWYGSWHDDVTFTEGSMRLTNNTTGDVQDVVFDQLTCQQPAGLVPGVNYFQSNATGNMFNFTPGTQLIAYHGNQPARQSFCWQGATFKNLPNADYTFEYIPIANPTLEWEPFDDITRTGTLSIKPRIGLALNATTTEKQVILTATLKNIGTEDLTNLSVPANLDAVFGAGTYQVKSITSNNNTFHNAAFDGSGVVELIGINQSLAVGEVRIITIVVDVKKLSDPTGNGIGNYEAQWQAVGKDRLNQDVLDLSTNGTNVDPEGDGAEDNKEKTPIDIHISELGFALNAVPTGKQVTLSTVLKNTGTQDLTQILIPANLDAVFGAGNYQVKSITSDNNTFHNAAFDGSGVVELIGTNQSLAVGEVRIITIVVDVKNLSDPTGNGIGNYEAQWQVVGKDKLNQDVLDLSTNGTNVDPEGDGAGDNHEKTPINIGLAELGLALSATTTGKQVTLSAVLKNTGTQDLLQILIPANLDAVFGAGNYQVKSITSDNNTFHNAVFDGSGVVQLIGNNQSLAVGVVRIITIVVDVKKLSDPTGSGIGNYEAQWQAVGKDRLNQDVLDLSTNGTNVDPEGDGAGDNQEKTPIQLHVSDLGLALNATTSGKQVTLKAIMKNLGTQVMSELSTVANLDAVFGAGNYQVKSITSDNNTFHNAAFDGSGVVQLIANHQALAVGDTREITIVVSVNKLTDPKGLGVGRYEAQWDLKGLMITTNDIVIDSSTNGLDPDPEGDGAGDNQEKTPINIGLAELGLALSATTTGKQVTLSAVLKNTGTQDLLQILIPANLDAVFGAGNYQVKSVASDNNTFHNAAFDGSGASELIGANQILAVGEMRTITITVVINKLNNPQGFGLGRYQAQWAILSKNASNDEIKDLSTNGTNPDPEGDGAGDNSEPTPIVLSYPELGVAQQATVNGQTVELLLTLSNRGNIPFSGLSLQNSLDDLFGAGTYRMIKISSPSGMHNPNYNGSTNTELLLSDKALPVGAQATLTITVMVDQIADRGDGTALYESQLLAKVLGMSMMDEAGKEVPVVDLSTNGVDPDPEGDGAANNFEKTPIKLVKMIANNTFEISKVASVKTVRVGDVMAWTITIKNTNPTYRFQADVTDTLPPSLSYVVNSARVGGHKNEPVLVGNQLTWSLGYIEPNQSQTIQLVTRITPNATLGKIKNLAQAFNSGSVASSRAEAFVEIVSEPIFDCSDVIGKVFEDDNRNGIQDAQEHGVAGMQLYTLNGLRMTTDAQGRYHVPCAAKPNADRGSNLAIKLDERGIAQGYELTTDNPLVQRATKGKLIKFNFGIAKKVSTTSSAAPLVEKTIELPASSAVKESLVSVETQPKIDKVSADKSIEVLPSRVVSVGKDSFAVVVDISPQIQGELRALLTELTFYYDLNRAKTKANDQLRAKITALLNQGQSMMISLDGYTDRSGTDKHNQALSAKRTTSVKQYLMQVGFDNKQVDWRVVNHGEHDLPVPTADGVQEPKNRLVKVRFELN